MSSVRRRWRVRVLGVVAGAVLAVLLGVQGAVVALADCGNVSAAVVQGAWQIRVTFDRITGTPPPNLPRQPGHVAVDDISFQQGCGAAGACGLLIQGPQSGSSFFSNESGFEGPNPDHPLVKQAGGATYESTFLPGGIGGPNLPPCNPPRLTRTLDLTVAQAVASASSSTGWNAAVITGRETIVDWWTCNGSVGVPSGIEDYTLLAVPAGSAFPASSTLACGASLVPPAIGGVSSGAVAQSSFSSALPTPSQTFGSAGTTVVNVVVTVGLVLFITFPAQLFNKTLEENYDDIRDIMSRRFGWLRRLRREAAADSTRETRLAVFAVVVLGGALLGSLNDPGFGFNASSWLTYLGVVASMMTGLWAGTFAAKLYRRSRGEDAAGHLHALPAGLLVAGACVLLSRTTHFTPGYLYGVIFGVAFTTKLSQSREGVGIVVGTVTTMLLAVLAWLLWLPVHDRSGGVSANAGLILVADILAPLVVGGFVGSVIGLFPLRFLSGGRLFGWNRSVWAATFGVALFGLVQVLLHPGSSPAHAGNAPLVTAVVLFLCFGALSVGFNTYFERRKKRRAVAPVAVGTP